MNLGMAYLFQRGELFTNNSQAPRDTNCFRAFCVVRGHEAV